MWKKKIRISWHIPNSSWDYNKTTASIWIRCLQLIKPLRNAGYHSYINSLRRKTDFSIFHRFGNEKAYQLLLEKKKRGSKVIFSSVVNYYEMEGNIDRIKGHVSKAQMEEHIKMTASSDGVITASKYILDRARRYNDNVVYIPDPVNSKHFTFRKDKTDFYNKRLFLIWCGYAVKASSLNTIKKALDELPFRLIVISESKPELEIPFDYIKWDYYEYPKQIVQGDICISPRVLDNSYDKGHSNFKITPFLFQGVPVVVSPQDSYLEVVSDGRNGYVAYDLDEWFYKLKTLNENRELLVRMSEESVKKASRYTIESVLPAFIDFLDSILQE